MNRDFCYRAEISKIFPIVLIIALPVLRAVAELGFLSRIGRNKFERLLILFSGTEPWPLHSDFWYFISMKTAIFAVLMI